MSDVLIEVSNLCCKAGATHLLYNINWNIKKGEHWIVFGQNGCGKTTLLSIIAGYKGFSSGTLKVFGEEYSDENILNLRNKIGWISSSFFDKYYTSERVIDIVLSGFFGTLGQNFNITNMMIKKAVQTITDVGLREKIIVPYDMLSKGERQQVLIARAFMSEPELLILDEPGTGLDSLAREELLTKINTLAEQKDKTIIFVTHYPEEILQAFDKCMLLRKGTVYKMGDTDKVFTSEIISDFFDKNVKITKQGKQYHLDILPEHLKGSESN